MSVTVSLAALNMNENEVKLLLAIKLLGGNLVSLRKAAEIVGYSQKAFAKVLLDKVIAQLKHTSPDSDNKLLI